MNFRPMTDGAAFHPPGLDDYLKERDAALRALDVEWARKMIPNASSDEVLLIALHKARYEATRIEDGMRQVSRRWLEERKYGRLGNLPWSTDGSLPE